MDWYAKQERENRELYRESCRNVAYQNGGKENSRIGYDGKCFAVVRITRNDSSWTERIEAKSWYDLYHKLWPRLQAKR